MKALADIEEGVREIKIREIEAGDDLLAIEAEADDDLEEETK